MADSFCFSVLIPLFCALVIRVMIDCGGYIVLSFSFPFPRVMLGVPWTSGLV